MIIVIMIIIIAIIIVNDNDNNNNNNVAPKCITSPVEKGKIALFSHDSIPYSKCIENCSFLSLSPSYVLKYVLKFCHI